MKINKYLAIMISTILASCSLSPGMNFNKDFTKDGIDYVYLDESKKITIPVIELSDYAKVEEDQLFKPYEIGVGDGLVITVWGLQEIFPMAAVNNDQNKRIVNANGTIFFPYVGEINVLKKTTVEVREKITKGLSEYFTDPQLDVSISSYNSQKIYILGEVTKPKRINLSETPLSLSDAIGESLGLRTETSSASEIYVIRSSSQKSLPKIFRADLSSPSGFLISNNFYLEDEDIVYINAAGTSRWNRVISQFFPFSSLLNSVDNLVTD